MPAKPIAVFGLCSFSALLLAAGSAPAPGKAPLPTVLLYPASAGDVPALTDLRTRLRLDGVFQVLTYDPDSPSVKRVAAEASHPEWLVAPALTDDARLALARALGVAFYIVVSPGREADGSHLQLVETAPPALMFDWQGVNRQIGARALESQAQAALAQEAASSANASLPVVVASVPAPEPSPVAAPPVSPVPAAVPVPVIVLPAPLPVVKPLPVPESITPPLPAIKIAPVAPPAPVAISAAVVQLPPVVKPLPVPEVAPALPMKIEPVAPPVPVVIAPPVPVVNPEPILASPDAPPAALEPTPIPKPLLVPAIPVAMVSAPQVSPSPVLAPPAPALKPEPAPPVVPTPVVPAPGPLMAMLPPRSLPEPASPEPTPEYKPQAKPEDLAAVSPLLTRGDAALEGGDVVGSISLYRQAVNGAPLSVVPRLKLAQAYQKGGLTDKALSEAKRALEIAPDNLSVQQFLTDLDQQNGTSDGSIARYQALLERSPDDPAAHSGLAEALWNSGDLNGAEAEYKTARKLAPADDHSAEAHLARLYATQARYDDCLTALSDAGKDGYALAIKIVRSRADTLSSAVESSREAFTAGKSTRERFYKGAQNVSAQAQALAGFVAKITPPAEYKLSHLHRMLSTNLLAQEAATLVTFIETGDAGQSDSVSKLDREAQTEMLTAQATEEKLGLWEAKKQP